MPKRKATKTVKKVMKVKPTKSRMTPEPYIERPTAYLNSKQLKALKGLKVGQKIRLTAVVTSRTEKAKRGESPAMSSGEVEITGLVK